VQQRTSLPVESRCQTTSDRQTGGQRCNGRSYSNPRKEAAVDAKEKTCYDSTIIAITKAVAALVKGVSGGFLQTSSARVLQKSINDLNKDEMDRQVLISFLSGAQGYAPKSGQIIGIRKQMGDTLAADLARATATKEAAIKTYDDLMASRGSRRSHSVD